MRYDFLKSPTSYMIIQYFVTLLQAVSQKFSPLENISAAQWGMTLGEGNIEEGER